MFLFLEELKPENWKFHPTLNSSPGKAEGLCQTPVAPRPGNGFQLLDTHVCSDFCVLLQTLCFTHRSQASKFMLHHDCLICLIILLAINISMVEIANM